MESGKWKVESGKRKVESGKWKVESGKWKVESKNLWDVLELILPENGNISGKINLGQGLAWDILDDYLSDGKVSELQEKVDNYGELREGLLDYGLDREKIKDLVNLIKDKNLEGIIIKDLKADVIEILGEPIINGIIDARGAQSNLGFAHEIIGKIINKTDVIKYDTYTEKFTVNFTKYKNDSDLKDYLSEVFSREFNEDTINDGIDTAKNVLTYILNEDGDFDGYKGDLIDLLDGYKFYREYSSKPSGGDGPSGNGGGGGGGEETPPKEEDVEKPKIKDEKIQVELDKDAIEVETGDDNQAIVKIEEAGVTEVVDELVEAVKKNPNLIPQLLIKLDDVDTLAMEVSIPASVMSQLAENGVELVIESEALSYEIPADALISALEGAPEGSYIEIISVAGEETEVEGLVEDEFVKNIAKVVELQLILKDSDGEFIKVIDKFNGKITIGIEIEAKDGNPDLLAVFYVDEEGNLKFVGGKVKGNKIIMTTDHYSKFAVIEYDKSFRDIEGHWSKDYVKSMVAKHIIDGFEDDTYRPEDKLTRAQFAKLLVEALELDKVAYRGDFGDVGSAHWAGDYIATAKQQGIISGYEDGTFRPENTITRAEMATMIANSLKLDTDMTPAEYLGGFKDTHDIPSWAVGYVTAVVAEELLVGSDGMLNPLGNVTRAEAATIIYRVYNR